MDSHPILSHSIKEESEDPPAFQDSKKKARDAKGRKDEDDKADKAATEVGPLCHEHTHLSL